MLSFLAFLAIMLSHNKIPTSSQLKLKAMLEIIPNIKPKTWSLPSLP